MYFGAEHLIGFFTWFPSAQWYLRKRGKLLSTQLFVGVDQISLLKSGQVVRVLTSYFGPALITVQDCSVQNSVMVPYNMLIWLKKSTVFTATHLMDKAA